MKLIDIEIEVVVGLQHFTVHCKYDYFKDCIQPHPHAVPVYGYFRVLIFIIFVALCEFLLLLHIQMY